MRVIEQTKLSDKEPVLGGAGLDHFRGDESARVHQIVGALRRLLREEEPFLARHHVGKNHVAVAGKIVAVGRVLRAGCAARSIVSTRTAAA